MGTLYWQFNDCWPVTSWSSLDYYGNWKAFHYQAKKSFEQLLLSVEVENEKYKVFLLNDTFENQFGKLELDLLSFDGKSLWKTSKEIPIGENSSTIIYEIPKTEFEKFDLKNSVLHIRFNKVESNYFFVKPKDLQLSKPNIQIRNIDEVTIEIFSDVLAKDVFLSSENQVFFEDNYFDLLPNEKRVIKLSKAVKEIKVKSLVDTL
jgi:beta-mannosidase